MKTRFNKVISALLIAIITGMSSSQTGQAIRSGQSLETMVKPPQELVPIPSLCPVAGVQPKSVLFADNLESGGTNWSFWPTTNEWSVINYGVSSPTHSLYGPDQGYQNDSYAAMNFDTPLPSGVSSYLYFYHLFNLEYYTGNYGYDGGVLEYSTNHGVSWIDVAPSGQPSLFSAGQDYNATLYSGVGNTLEGRRAFSGNSGGIVASRYDLSTLAGQSVRFRWRIGTDVDNKTAVTGWAVDDVLIYTCSTTTTRAPFDFNGDNKTDVAVYRPSAGTWYIKDQFYTNYGLSGDLPIPGDYNGDGKTDVAVYRPSAGTWYIKGQFYTGYGLTGDQPIPGDYNGDGKTDVAVYRPSTGTWYIKDQFYANYGLSGDIPLPGDYNGDGKTDVAVYRPSAGTWYIKDQFYANYGLPGDIPVPGDYNGDGKTDVAVYRPSQGTWYIKDQGFITYGLPTDDIPIPGDYNGDSKTDIAIYRPSAGTWYIKDQFYTGYGLPGDIPLPELSTGKASTAP